MTREELKALFVAGKTLTETDFAALIDNCALVSEI